MAMTTMTITMTMTIAEDITIGSIFFCLMSCIHGKKEQITIGNMFPSLHDDMVKCYQRRRYRQTLWSPITSSEVKKTAQGQ